MRRKARILSVDTKDEDERERQAYEPQHLAYQE